MRTLENNDWIFLNSVIFLIHSAEGCSEMRSSLIEQLRMMLDFDSATFYVTSPEDSHALADPVVYNITPELGEKYMREYATLDYARGLLFSGKSIIYRESDIMPDEKRVQTEYYRSCYIPYNWHYSLSMNITYKGRFLGVLTLFRYRGRPNFEYEDIFVLEMLKEHLEYRLYRDICLGAPAGDKLTAHQCAEEYGLTKREETILQAIAAGNDNGMVCGSLCITNNTLKKHILNIYRKMGIKSRVQMLQLVNGSTK
jgi:DNA-binding CsgD family transcriptional regulator